jgi:hypothetical protein
VISEENLVTGLKIAACVCGKDGIISQAEEDMMFKLVSDKYDEFPLNDFDSIIDDFFDSEKQIEDYLLEITDSETRHFVLELSTVSASADGLDIRENIALNKIAILWGINLNE